MTHPAQDDLLLLAYDELPMARVDQILPHIAGCRACKDALTQFDCGRTGLDFMMLAARATPATPATPARRGPTIAGATLALAAAATLAAVSIVRSGGGPVREPVEHWTPTTTWSATAGYVTGKAMLDIDAQLTRLEQEPRYGLPN